MSHPNMSLTVAGERSPLRLVPVDGDHMQPTLWRGDAVAVVPVTAYSYEGLYVIDGGGLPVVYRCQSDLRGGIMMLKDNKAYATTDTMTREEFERVVLGKVAVVCRVVDPLLLRRAAP